MRLLFLYALILFSACNESKTSGNKKVFRYNEATGISSLDPAFANDQAKIWACNHLYNGLVQLDDSLRVQPCIAKNWTISGDGKTYRFYLRTDVKFHDDPLLAPGRKVTAADFVYSFGRITDEKTASPGAWVFGKLSNNPQKPGVVAVNDSVLEINLSDPFPPFLGLLSSSYCAVVPMEVVKAYGKDFRRHPVGTGPFRFHDWIERSALILHRNNQYFEKDAAGNSLPYLDAVMISFISDKQSAFLEFLKGKLDLISGLDPSYKDDLLTREGSLREKYKGKFRMETAPYLNTEYLGILMDPALPLMQNNPLTDVRIRKVISYGFDRAKMIRYLRNNMATPGTGGMVPPGLPGFDKAADYGYSYQPDSARKLLREAGYPDGKGLPEIVISATHSYQDLCEYIQGQLAGIGIKVRLDINQAAQHRQMVAKQQLACFRGSWIADYADAENYLSLFVSANKAPAGPNYTHYSNSEYDKLFSQAMVAINDSVRYQKYREMDSLVISQAPVIILYYDRVLRLSGNNVTGLRMNSMNLLNLKNVRKLETSHH